MIPSMLLSICLSILVLSNYEMSAKYLLVKIENDSKPRSINGYGDYGDYSGQGKSVQPLTLYNLNKIFKI